MSLRVFSREHIAIMHPTIDRVFLKPQKNKCNFLPLTSSEITQHFQMFFEYFKKFYKFIKLLGVLYGMSTTASEITLKRVCSSVINSYSMTEQISGNYTIIRILSWCPFIQVFLRSSRYTNRLTNKRTRRTRESNEQLE